MCYNTGLVIRNGRTNKDQEGKFTFCSTKGRSVNDYVLVPGEDFNTLKGFEVLEFNELSDDAALLSKLTCVFR